MRWEKAVYRNCMSTKKAKPRKKHMMMITLNEADTKLLNAHAEREETTKVEIIRRALRQYKGDKNAR